MARHFLQLYLLIVATLAAASWGQERLWEAYAHRQLGNQTADLQPQAAALAIVEQQLRGLAEDDRARHIAQLASNSGVDLELFELQDIAGPHTLERLERGELALMNAADGRTWMLQRLEGDGRVLAFRFANAEPQRGWFEWLLALLFYAAIALVIMTWLWPLTRDLRRLEQATMSFGHRNWTFDADIRARSQVYPLARAFRRMAARIDSLIGSHKDMSNAVSHEIKTPLARMRFELEMARTAATPQKLAAHFHSIDMDIAELDRFVTATLDYAILERADVTLNVAEHDFTAILPAVVESARRSARSSRGDVERSSDQGQADLTIDCEVPPDAKRVVCDAHLMETVVRNLLYNAIRYARRQIRVTFRSDADGAYTLRVDDDGPGIAPADRERVFGSFVRLAGPSDVKTGFGLGLAIVKRILEWHGGEVGIADSPLGGAGFFVRWSQARVVASQS